jgi:hypothetical protein
MAKRTDATMDRQSEEWLVGFRIGLVLAEQCMSEIMRKGGTIEVLDADRNVIFASPVRDLLAIADGEGSAQR